jgi:hypothetical protein
MPIIQPPNPLSSREGIVAQNAWSTFIGSCAANISPREKDYATPSHENAC